MLHCLFILSKHIKHRKKCLKVFFFSSIDFKGCYKMPFAISQPHAPFTDFISMNELSDTVTAFWNRKRWVLSFTFLLLYQGFVFFCFFYNSNNRLVLPLFVHYFYHSGFSHEWTGAPVIFASCFFQNTGWKIKRNSRLFFWEREMLQRVVGGLFGGLMVEIDRGGVVPARREAQI